MAEPGEDDATLAATAAIAGGLDADDLQMSRAVARELYAKGVATRITNLLVDLEIGLETDLGRALARLSARDEARLVTGNYTTERLRRMIEVVQTFSVEWARIVREQLDAGGLDLIAAEIAFEQRYVAALVAEHGAPAGIVALLDATVAPVQVFNAAKRRPMQTRVMRELWPEMTRNVRRRATDALRQSYLSGETIGQTTGRIRRELDVNRRGAEMVARTGLAHYADGARSDTIAALGVEHVQWLSTLDGRTTSLCRSLDRKVFRLDDANRPRVPRHPGCRSSTQPWWPGIDQDDAERASRSPEGPKPVQGENESRAAYDRRVAAWRKGVGKPVSGRLSYESWLRRQPASYAREILGPERYRLWRKGLTVDKFTDAKATRTLTIAELRAKYASLFPDPVARAA